MKKKEMINILGNIVRVQSEVMQDLAMAIESDKKIPRRVYEKFIYVGKVCADTHNAAVDGKSHEECVEIFTQPMSDVIPTEEDKGLTELKDILETLVKDLENASVKTNK